MEIDFMSMTLAEIVGRSNSLSEINTRYQDVAHQIELLPMDAVTLSKKVKELKAILRERRVAKECVCRFCRRWVVHLKATVLLWTGSQRRKLPLTNG